MKKIASLNLLLLFILLATFSFAQILASEHDDFVGDKRHDKALVAIFKHALKGKLTFHCINSHKTSVSGIFLSGFKGSSNCTKATTSPNGYKIRVVKRPKCPSFNRKYDLTPRLKYKITSIGGTTPMGCKFDFGLDDIKGYYAQVSRNRVVIDYAPLKPLC